MNKQKFKFLVDALMFFSFLIISFSGFMLWRKNYSFISRVQLIKMHNLSSVIFILFLLIHLILNWQWIKYMFKDLFGRGEFIDLREKNKTN